jgi:hypothetical protein
VGGVDDWLAAAGIRGRGHIGYVAVVGIEGEVDIGTVDGVDLHSAGEVVGIGGAGSNGEKLVREGTAAKKLR